MRNTLALVLLAIAALLCVRGYGTAREAPQPPDESVIATVTCESVTSGGKRSTVKAQVEVADMVIRVVPEKGYANAINRLSFDAALLNERSVCYILPQCMIELPREKGNSGMMSVSFRFDAEGASNDCWFEPFIISGNYKGDFTIYLNLGEAAKSDMARPTVMKRGEWRAIEEDSLQFADLFDSGEPSAIITVPVGKYAVFKMPPAT